MADIADPSRAVALGIPDDAARVLVLSESSHWDPNWLLSSEAYYQRFVRRTLDLALEELRADPKRVFSLECVFFLARYWEDRPEKHDELRALLNSRRLRLSGSGVTTPDTILPETESILRDFLVGQQWLRDRGISQEPEVAYLPDNFGNSPGLPAILRAAGFRYTAFSRLDGMYFPATDYRPASDYPLAGSNAARLLLEDKSLDFVWRSGTSEVLSHWNAFTYGQGDLLAARGLVRWMGFLLGWPDRSESGVAARIDIEVARLAPLSRTRYLFCPIGFDFNPPIARLGELVDRYNRTRYPTSGTWVVLAGLDDYFALVDQRRSDLPVLDLDPNPYWMGFLSSRPGLKQRSRRLARALVAREGEAITKDPEARPDLRAPWWRAVLSNHHDFITGTAPTRVVVGEQEPWLEEAEKALELPPPDPRPPRAPRPSDAKPPRSVTSWCVEGSVFLDNGVFEIQIEPDSGGRTTIRDRSGNTATLDVIAHEDTGGLWRLGHELQGGTFAPLDRASNHKGEVLVATHPRGWAKAEILTAVDGRQIQRTVELHAGEDRVWLGIRGRAKRWRTVTGCFEGAGALALHMDVPGGEITRPAVRLYDPTFWAARSTVTPDGAPYTLSCEDGLAVASTAIGLQFVALRNAPIERARGWLPVLSHPAWGPNDRIDTTRVCLRFGSLEPTVSTLGGLTLSGGVLLATKPAEDGRGIVVRIELFADQALLEVPWAVASAWTCDARERDGAALAPPFVFESKGGRIQSVRLVRAKVPAKVDAAMAPEKPAQ